MATGKDPAGLLLIYNIYNLHLYSPVVNIFAIFAFSLFHTYTDTYIVFF